MDRLPVKLKVLIFQYLSLEELCTMRQVCRRLHDLIDGAEVRQLFPKALGVSSRPLLHNEAHMTGMPHTVKTLPIKQEPLGLDNGRLIFSEDDPLKILDLRTGRFTRLPGYHFVNGYVIPVAVYDQLDIVDDEPVIACDGDRYCHWNDEGVYVLQGEQLSFTKLDYRFYSKHAVIVDEWLYLIGVAAHLYLLTFRLSDMIHTIGSYWPDLRDATVMRTQRAGLLLHGTGHILGHWWLDLSNGGTLHKLLFEGEILAMYSDVVYRSHKGSMLAQCFEDNVKMARIDRIPDRLLVDDHFMVGVEEDHVDVYAMNPDFASGERLHRLFPAKQINVDGWWMMTGLTRNNPVWKSIEDDLELLDDEMLKNRGVLR